MKIRQKLKEWYLDNKRPLPWRETKDPYRIWISEIILQQTRVAQGMDYYHRFLERFPDIRTLAEAEEDEVMKVCEGLGYYSRARNLHAAARQVLEKHGAQLPVSYDELLELKGTGAYTASAVSSIAAGEPRAVIDGNVHRVISRLYGIEELPKGYASSSLIRRKAEELLDHEDPSTHNQAVMELGALVCTPTSPACVECPLKSECIAFRDKRTAELPLRPKPGVKRKRYFNYLLISNGEHFWLRRRTAKDIWQGLYELPLIETPHPTPADRLVETNDWKVLLNPQIRPQQVSEPIRHVLSHQEIQARFYHIQVNHSYALSGYEKIHSSRLVEYPLPILILNYIKKHIGE